MTPNQQNRPIPISASCSLEAASDSKSAIPMNSSFNNIATVRIIMIALCERFTGASGSRVGDFG